MSRGYLTKREWDALLEQQGGKCCVGLGDKPGDAGERQGNVVRQDRPPGRSFFCPAHRKRSLALRIRSLFDI